MARFYDSIVLTQTLVTEQPGDGRATVELVTLNRQAEVTYTPQPGYAGPDRFSVTLEPRDLAVSVGVTVTPPS